MFSQWLLISKHQYTNSAALFFMLLNCNSVVELRLIQCIKYQNSSSKEKKIYQFCFRWYLVFIYFCQAKMKYFTDFQCTSLKGISIKSSKRFSPICSLRDTVVHLRATDGMFLAQKVICVWKSSGTQSEEQSTEGALWWKLSSGFSVSKRGAAGQYEGGSTACFGDCQQQAQARGRLLTPNLCWPFLSSAF